MFDCIIFRLEFQGLLDQLISVSVDSEFPDILHCDKALRAMTERHVFMQIKYPLIIYDIHF